jgi:hypothetical protein
MLCYNVYAMRYACTHVSVRLLLPQNVVAANDRLVQFVQPAQEDIALHKFLQHPRQPLAVNLSSASVFDFVLNRRKRSHLVLLSQHVIHIFVIDLRPLF